LLIPFEAPAQEGSLTKRRRLQPASNKTPFQSPTLATAKSEARVVAGGYDGMRTETDNLADVPFGGEMTKFDILHQHISRILAPTPKGRFILSFHLMTSLNYS